jgi:hypothetical protein
MISFLFGGSQMRLDRTLFAKDIFFSLLEAFLENCHQIVQHDPN